METGNAVTNTAPAAVTPVTTEAQLEDFTPAQYDHWRKTGESPKPEAPAASESKQEAKPDQEQPPKDEDIPQPADAAEAAPAQAQEKNRRKPGAEERIRQLSRQYREAQEEIERLKSAAPKSESQPSVKATQAAPQPAQEDAFPNHADLDDKGQFKYRTDADLQQAQKDWYNRQREREIAQVRQETAAAVKRELQIQEVQKRFPDFEATIVPAARTITGSPEALRAIGPYLEASSLNSEILHHLGTDEKLLDSVMQLAKQAPHKALRLIVDIEREFEGDTREVSSDEAPAKKVTSAPPPPHEVGSSGSAGVDDVARALKDDDFTAYAKAQNRREMDAKRRTTRR